MRQKSIEFRKFILKFGIIVFIIIVSDQIIGRILKHYYFENSSGLLYTRTFAIDSTKAETLVFGSSRALHHYVPTVFEKELKTTFYNCGQDGLDLFYYAAVIKAVTSRYKPKRVLIDILPDEFSFNDIDRLSALLPYKDNVNIYPYILEKSRYERLKLLSQIYPYNSLLTTIMVGNFKFNRSRRNNMEGYVPFTDTMENVKPEKTSEKEAIIPRKVAIFTDLLKYLNDKNIQCYVIISPSYLQQGNYPTQLLIKKNCQEFQVKLFQFSNRIDYLSDYTLFSDWYHLNNGGAIKFSNEICSNIKVLEKIR